MDFVGMIQHDLLAPPSTSFAISTVHSASTTALKADKRRATVPGHPNFGMRIHSVYPEIMRCPVLINGKLENCHSESLLPAFMLSKTLLRY